MKHNTTYDFLLAMVICVARDYLHLSHHVCLNLIIYSRAKVQLATDNRLFQVWNFRQYKKKRMCVANSFTL